MQGPECSPGADSCFGNASLAENPLCIQVHERVQFRIQTFDLGEMRVGEFDRRDFLLADLLRHAHRGKKGRIAHLLLLGPA